MPDTAIILAGGLGTRLRPVVTLIPKCMAPINGSPFIGYLIHHLQNQGIKQFIFCVGYLKEMIIEYVQKEFPGLDSKFSIEDDPLGTGGAVLAACAYYPNGTAVICNGDTLFKVNIPNLAGFHHESFAHCTLGLKNMSHFDRYGVVELNPDHSIKSFKEKQWYDSGLINGGVYTLNTDKFLEIGLPHKFSFEKDYLEKYYHSGIYGFVEDSYFIDIGIPEDYARAQKELAS